MLVDDATIEIRTRRTTEIVDLAFVFYRTHLRVLGGVTLALGVPLVAAAAALHSATGRWWAAALFFWLTLPLPSGAVTLAASRIVFGTRLTVGRALALYGPLWAGLFFRRLLQQILTLLLLPFVVGYTLRLKWGFTPMIVLLERLSGRALATRRVGLRRRGGSSGFGLEIALAIFLIAALLGLAITFELVAVDFLSILPDGALFTTRVLDEPLRFALWLLAALVASPLGTLSWFFLYLNARIRGEGWDIELGLKGIAARLAAGDKEAAA
jgi:hypothetical protein